MSFSKRIASLLLVAVAICSVCVLVSAHAASPTTVTTWREVEPARWTYEQALDWFRSVLDSPTSPIKDPHRRHVVLEDFEKHRISGSQLLEWLKGGLNSDSDIIRRDVKIEEVGYRTYLMNSLRDLVAKIRPPTTVTEERYEEEVPEHHKSKYFEREELEHEHEREHTHEREREREREREHRDRDHDHDHDHEHRLRKDRVRSKESKYDRDYDSDHDDHDKTDKSDIISNFLEAAAIKKFSNKLSGIFLAWRPLAWIWRTFRAVISTVLTLFELGGLLFVFTSFMSPNTTQDSILNSASMMFRDILLGFFSIFEKRTRDIRTKDYSTTSSKLMLALRLLIGGPVSIIGGPFAYLMCVFRVLSNVIMRNVSKLAPGIIGLTLAYFLLPNFLWKPLSFVLFHVVGMYGIFRFLVQSFRLIYSVLMNSAAALKKSTARTNNQGTAFPMSDMPPAAAPINSGVIQTDYVAPPINSGVIQTDYVAPPISSGVIQTDYVAPPLGEVLKDNVNTMEGRTDLRPTVISKRTTTTTTVEPAYPPSRTTAA